MAVVAVVSAGMATCSLVFSGMRMGLFLYISFNTHPISNQQATDMGDYRG